MAKNTNLHNAKNAKNDEFYTQLDDVSKEMQHYREFFKGKKVLCNCNDGNWSAFFQYFSKNFDTLGLAKLTSISHSEDGHGKKYVFTGDKNGNRKVDDDEIEVTELNGNGDFRSEECIEFLKEADIVVTNPPFSLFREYVAQLMEYGKKFLIIGNSNAITYKETFPLIKENKLWLGVSPRSMDFVLPNGETSNVNACWFTNLEHTKRNERLELTKRYSNEYYPKYDNYDAIEVGKTVDIPLDYKGVMGVPITFLDKYNPDQFEIIGLDRYTAPKEVLVGGRVAINGKPTYARILIRHKK